MSDYGATDTTTTTLGANQFPVSAVFVPGDSKLTTLEGGAKGTDGNGKTSASASMLIKDGNDVTQGSASDANTVNSIMGRLTKIRDLLNATLTVSGSVTTSGTVTETNSAGIKSDLDTLASIVASSKAAVQDIETANYVVATSPPTTTNAGSDTSYTFSSQVNRVIMQNNTSANVNYAFDVAATAGSLVLVPGAMLVYSKKCTTLHLYTAAAQNINGTTPANIVVLGAL